MNFEDVSDIISTRTSIAMHEDGVEALDWDEMWEEYWLKEAASYIKDQEPGWEVLASEM